MTAQTTTRAGSVMLVLCGTMLGGLHAQARNVEQRSALEGVVIGRDGRPLAGVDVVAMGTGRSAVTDERGAFSLMVRPGTFEVHVRSPWFELTRRTVTVTGRGATRMEIVLPRLVPTFCDERGRAAREACAVLQLGPPDQRPLRPDSEPPPFLDGSG